MKDADIISLYFARSEQAIRATKEQYGKLIRHIISGIVKNPEDTDECENDTYYQAWNAIPPNRPHSLKAYLAVIARNQAFKRWEYLHADKRDPETAVSFDELAECLCSDRASNSYTDAELRETINAFLRTLTREHRCIFLLRYWQGYSIEEITHLCGGSKSRIESILFRMRKKMRTFLEERGYLE